MNYLPELEHWIREREKIRVRRLQGLPRPWTKDAILDKHHFCNVNRQHDRGTIHIQEVVRRRVANENALPSVYTMARMFNKADTVELMLDTWKPDDDPAHDQDVIEYLQDSLGKVFHTAYVVSTCGKSMNKIQYVMNVTRAVNKIYVPKESCDSAYRAINNVDGMGTFMAAQVVADLKNDRYLEGVPDWFSFCSMGPGSKKGLNYIYGGGTNQGNFRVRIQQLWEAMPQDVQELVQSMQDFQNVLCEYSKYMRYLNNDPGRRRYYV